MPLATDRIQHVLIAGGGTMGQDVAAFCVSRGLSVKVFDRDPQALEKGVATKSLVSRLVHHDAVWLNDRTRILQHLAVETQLQTAATGADLVIECLPENVKLKRKFFEQVSLLVRPTTIIATNTSMLVPSQLREAVQDPSRFAALHFINETRAVEIMGHNATSPQTIQRLEDFARQIQLVPILCRKEKPGCILNSMLSILNFNALILAAEGYASIEDIDRIWMMTERAPRGPFGNLDIVGLDTAHDITRVQAVLTGDPQMVCAAEFLRSYVKQGRLGVKTRAGFYGYPDPAYAHPTFCKPQLPHQLHQSDLAAC